MSGHILLRPEQVLSRLVENCSVALSEFATLQTKEDFIYISDPETYELYHISVQDPAQLTVKWADYQGKKCYAVLQGRDTPCPFCTNHLLRYDQYYIWTHFNPIMGKEYLLRDKLVDWNGKRARLEVVTDFTTPEHLKQLLLKTVASQNMLMNCTQTILNEVDTEDALRQILAHIADYFKAQWGYIYCFGETSYHVEWSCDGKHHPQLFHTVPRNKNGGQAGGLAAWEQTLTCSSQILLKDAELLRERDAEGYALLRELGVKSFCTAPLFLGGQLSGFLTLDNCDPAFFDQLPLLNSLAANITATIMREQLRQEKWKLQYYDALTGAPNLAGYRKDIGNILARQPQRRYALCHGDIKNFKYINDAFGFDVGSQLLRYGADFAASRLREGETFCRESADNFSIFCYYEDARELAGRFAAYVQYYNDFPPLAAKNFRVDLTGGVYLLQEDEPFDLDLALNRANMAKMSVKALPGSRFAVYTDELREKKQHELRLESEMRSAIQQGEFMLYFQPQIKLHGEKRLTRAEALVRWKRNGALYAVPSDFISLFEKNGMIVELDQYVFEQACQSIRRFKAQGVAPLCLAVNVSRLSLLRPDFVRRYSEIKEAWQIADGELELEFTESVAVRDYQVLRQALTQLKQAGFLCAMDDFGAEQSSLNALQNLPLDVLKLDRMFFAGNASRGRVIVESVLQMAKRLQMQTVAEGVEDRELVEDLRAMGCDYAQGYVFSRPLPEAEYVAWLRQNV